MAVAPSAGIFRKIRRSGNEWVPSVPLLKFYTAFVVFCLGDRAWTFVNAFFFELLGGMRLVSADQFVESCFAMLLATCVGNWLDRHNRRTGAIAMLSANSLGLALSATLLGICMFIDDTQNAKSAQSPTTTTTTTPTLLGAAFTILLVFAIFLCSLTKCAAEGERLVFTKDWIVVLARSESCALNNTEKKQQMETALSKRNATMVVIDQFASVLGPLAAGFILAWFGHKFMCALIVGWNLFALVATRMLLNDVYRNVGELAQRQQKAPMELKAKTATGKEDMNEENKEEQQQEQEQLPTKSTIDNNDKSNTRRSCYRFSFFAQIRIYYRQTVFPAAFGLALLYMTVLGFDGLAVSFGKAQGMEDNILGVFRSFSSVIGLLGAVSFAPTEKRMGLRRTGLVGLTTQHLCLWLCVVSIWLPGSPFAPISYMQQWTLDGWLHSSKSAFEGVQQQQQQLLENATTVLHDRNGTVPLVAVNVSPGLSILVFFIGITLARFGLWMADLAIIQLMQLHIPESQRGTVFGVQNGVSQLFSMLKDILVIVLPDPRTFGFLIILSIICVGTGFVQYIYYLLKTKNWQGRRSGEEQGRSRNGGSKWK